MGDFVASLSMLQFYLEMRKMFYSRAISSFDKGVAGAAAFMILLTGCGDVFGTSAGSPVSISFSGARTGPTLSQGQSPSLSMAGTNAEVVVLNRVDLMFSEVTLERAEGGLGGDSDGDSDTDSDSDGPNNERIRTGPVTIALPLNGGVITPFDEMIPSGFYEEIELDLTEVLVEGTADGEAFSLTIAVDRELEMEFEPPFEVSEGVPFNITVLIDPSTWFDATIDPRFVAGNTELMKLLSERIARSFKAFEDSDRDADDADSDSDQDSD